MRYLQHFQKKEGRKSGVFRGVPVSETIILKMFISVKYLNNENNADTIVIYKKRNPESLNNYWHLLQTD